MTAQILDLNAEKKLKDFSDLLKSIESIDDKKRQLWAEIYSNAISERQNAYLIFAELYAIAATKSTEYAIHGRTLTSCIERMSKANDQLIRLAELVAKADSTNDVIDPEDMFNRINRDKKR